MPPPLLIDLDQVDLDRVSLTREEIYQHLPHRHEFMLLDGVCHVDAAAHCLVAFVDVRPEAWWVRGHVPGRPLLPGVLMLEMAAQASALAAKTMVGQSGFIGFGGIEECRFRDIVVPSQRLYIICSGKDYRPRRVVSLTQGVVERKLVFEATITGLALR
ncbi:MAG: 3-hydroxyacyl-ACP dehydratase FabZ family protein [Phycisphaerae bacterium]|jgi:3-hydroxyacyl-[acyl-carrier-protein] dehydratase